MSRTLGVLLAGGRGERLGLGSPKALAVVGGATLLERATAVLMRVSDEVLVAAPRGTDLSTGRGIRRVFDSGEGPLAAMVAALGGGGFDRACVLGVDFPLMRAEALAAILGRLAPGDAAVVPAPGGQIQPLAAAYAPGAARDVADAFARGERSIVRAVLALEPRILDPHQLATLPGGLDNFINVNTPEDLAAADRRLGEREVGA